MAQVMLTPMGQGDPAKRTHEWLGGFKWHSWTNQWLGLQGVLWRMSLLQPGHYYKGHMGFLADVERFLWYANIGMLFLYRDLRDVAVSQAYHIINADNMRLHHPGRETYAALGGFDDVLSAVIEGLGPFPGVVERWEAFAGWLDVEWVLSLRFEDLINEPEEAAGRILQYALRNGAAFADNRVDFEPETYEKLVTAMVNSGKQTNLSTTYRKGQPGEWREAFKPEHIDLWQKHDPDNWIKQLGYEDA